MYSKTALIPPPAIVYAMTDHQTPRRVNRYCISSKFLTFHIERIKERRRDKISDTQFENTLPYETVAQPKNRQSLIYEHHGLSKPQVMTLTKEHTIHTHFTVWYAENNAKLHTNFSILCAISQSVLLWGVLRSQPRHIQMSAFVRYLSGTTGNNSDRYHPEINSKPSIKIPQPSIHTLEQSFSWMRTAPLLSICPHHTRLSDGTQPYSYSEKLKLMDYERFLEWNQFVPISGSLHNRLRRLHAKERNQSVKDQPPIVRKPHTYTSYLFSQLACQRQKIDSCKVKKPLHRYRNHSTSQCKLPLQLLRPSQQTTFIFHKKNRHHCAHRKLCALRTS